MIFPEPVFTSKRTYESTPRSDGGVETHVKVECTLADIARATNLRPEDAAFALNECGLLQRRVSRRAAAGRAVSVISTANGNGNGTAEPEDIRDGEYTIVITRELVEKVAKERNVKIMYLDLSCVLI